MKKRDIDIELTDLRSITRDSDGLLTRVFIYPSRYKSPVEWLRFGETQLRNESDKLCWLYAYLRDGTTDWEHDSAYALRLPMIGLQFDSVSYHSTRLTAYVDPQNADEFHVPTPGYDPTMHEEAVACEQCEEPHIMVPEGFYVPPFNRELYEKVRGRKIEIRIGVVRE